MSRGTGTIGYDSTSGGGGVAAGVAKDGLSIKSILGVNTVVLGNDLGDVLQPAILLDNREIPMAGFSVVLTGSGATATGVLTIRQDAAKLIGTPDVLLQDPAALEIGRINMPGSRAADQGSVFIGRDAGALQNNLNVSSVAIGWRALPIATSAQFSIAIGYEALFFLTTGGSNVAIGVTAMQNQTTGGNNTAVGRNALFQNQTGINNSVLGRDAGSGFYLASSNNVAIGFQCALQNGVPPGQTDRNTYIGSSIARVANGGILGSDNVAIGFGIYPGAFIFLGGNIFIGANITSAANTVTNATIIGQAMANDISNLVRLGRADQNVVIGSTVSVADPGARLQVLGTVMTDQGAMTNAPGKWRLGKVITAASVFNAAKYLETEIDGVVVKVCIN